MPIHLPAPPPEASAEFDIGTEMLLGTPQLVELGDGDFPAGLPHRVYSVGLGELDSGAEQDAAKQDGWRYLLGAGNLADMAVEVSNDGPASSSYSFIGMNEGPFVQFTVDAIEALEGNPRLAEADYEIRLLRAPALFIYALWLVPGDNDHDELFIPLPTSHEVSGLEAGSVYEAAPFFQYLQEAARQRLAASPARGSGRS